MAVLRLKAFVVGCLAAGSTVAAPAAAQPANKPQLIFDPPEVFFNRGVEYMRQGLYDKACPEILASYVWDPLPGTLFTLAECEAKRGRIATSITLYEKYLTELGKMAPDQKARHQERATITKAQIAALSPAVPKIVLSLPPEAPKGTVVTWDGTALAASALGVEMPVDPGNHRVVTRTPDGQVAMIDMSIAKGEKKQFVPYVKKTTDAPEVLFNVGVQYMLEGRFEKACPAIQESYRVDPLPGTLFTLAECEAKRGRIATAAAQYDDYLVAVAAMPPAQRARHLERATAAKAQRELLAPDIPKVMLMLPPDAPASLVVTLDDKELPATSLGVELPINPGNHHLMVRVTERNVHGYDISIRKGTTRRVLVELTVPSVEGASIEPSVMKAPIVQPPAKLRPPTDPAPRELPPSPGSPGSLRARRIGAYVTGGVGFVGLVVGAVTGGFAIAEKSTINAECNDTACTRAGKEAADRLKPYGTASTIGFGIGVVGVGVATVLLLLSRPQPKSAGTARSGGAHWVNVGVLSVGPTGTLVGLRGGW